MPQCDWFKRFIGADGHSCAGFPTKARTYLVFGDIAGKLTVLRVECTRCARKGRYSVAQLLAQYGHRGNMTKWISDVKGDCPKRDVPQLHDRCDLICPDLPKVSRLSPNALISA